MTTHEQQLQRQREKLQSLENAIREQQKRAQRLYVNPVYSMFPYSHLSTAQGHIALSNAARISRQLNRRRAKIYDVAAKENPEHAATYRQHAAKHNAHADINHQEAKAQRLLAAAHRTFAEAADQRARVMKMRIEEKAPDPLGS